MSKRTQKNAKKEAPRGILAWIGSQESYDQVILAQSQVAEGIKAGMYCDEPDDDELPPLWSMRGSTAVVEIAGPLVQGSAGWWRMFGVIGYDDIAQAALQAALNPDTKALMFNINSPGGDVQGVMDCSRVLSTITGMKPSAVYTGSQMCSGGYWLSTGVQGQKFASETAVVGSIGVIQIVSNYVEMDKMNGIGRNVLRAGKYKAELNPYEKPSDEALARAQENLNVVHGLFRKAVAASRPNLSAEELASVTEGQTFMGARAKSAGLVDRITSFDQALKLLDSTVSTSNTSSTSKGKAMKITDLTSDQIAQIMAGQTPAGVDAAIASQFLAALNIGAPAAAQAPAVAALPVAAPAAGAATPAAAAPAPTAIDVLTQQIASKDTQLVTVNAELMTLKGQTKLQADAHEPLLGIARTETKRMLVALNASDAALEGMDAQALIAEHARVTELFQKNFKPGGVGAPGAAGGDDQNQVKTVDPLFLQAVKNAPTANR
jgi:signal peptide peptidase SppA